MNLKFRQSSERKEKNGVTGTVAYVDDMGTLHMKWDNGRSLGICPDADSFEVIKEVE